MIENTREVKRPYYDELVLKMERNVPQEFGVKLAKFDFIRNLHSPQADQLQRY